MNTINSVRTSDSMRDGSWLRVFVIMLAMAAALIGFAPSALAQSVNLSASYPDRSGTVYNVELESTQVLELGAVRREIKSNYGSRVRIKKSGEAGGLTTFDLTHERVAVAFTAAGGGPGIPAGSYDSDRPDRAETREIYEPLVKPLVGKTVKVDVTADGEIAAVRGLAKLAPEGDAGTLFRVLFTERTFRDMYGWLFSLKPAPHTAELGETWNIVRSENNDLGSLRTLYELTLKKVEADVATIDVLATGELIGAMPGTFAVTGENGEQGTVTGSITWDPMKQQVRQLQTSSTTIIQSQMQGMGVKMIIQAKTSAQRASSSPPATSPATR